MEDNMNKNKKSVYISNEELLNLPTNETKSKAGKSIFKFLIAIAAGIGVEAALVFAPLDPATKIIAMGAAGAGFVGLVKKTYTNAIGAIGDHIFNDSMKNNQK